MAMKLLLLKLFTNHLYINKGGAHHFIFAKPQIFPPQNLVHCGKGKIFVAFVDIAMNENLTQHVQEIHTPCSCLRS